MSNTVSLQILGFHWCSLAHDHETQIGAQTMQHETRRVSRLWHMFSPRDSFPFATCLDNIGHCMKSVHHSYVYSHLCLIVALHFNWLRLKLRVLQKCGVVCVCVFFLFLVSLSQNHSFWLYGRHFTSFQMNLCACVCDCMCCHVLIFKSNAGMQCTKAGAKR